MERNSRRRARRDLDGGSRQCKELRGERATARRRRDRRAVPTSRGRATANSLRRERCATRSSSRSPRPGGGDRVHRQRDAEDEGRRMGQQQQQSRYADRRLGRLAVTRHGGPRDTYGNALGGFFPTDFNGDISKWDTASVTTFDLTVRDSPLRLARAPPLTLLARFMPVQGRHQLQRRHRRWDTAKATCFNSVFNEAQKFNRDLDWDTAKVITFDSLVSAARRLLCRASPPPLIPSRRPAAVRGHH